MFAENGTISYDSALLSNTTINYAENEIDNSHERGTENADTDEDSRGLIIEMPKPGITLARPPRLPNHPGSAVGPFFEDGPQPYNVTAKLGTTVLLDCKIGLLYDKTVSRFVFARLRKACITYSYIQLLAFLPR